MQRPIPLTTSASKVHQVKAGLSTKIRPTKITFSVFSKPGLEAYKDEGAVEDVWVRLGVVQAVDGRAVGGGGGAGSTAVIHSGGIVLAKADHHGLAVVAKHVARLRHRPAHVALRQVLVVVWRRRLHTTTAPQPLLGSRLDVLGVLVALMVCSRGNDDDDDGAWLFVAWHEESSMPCTTIGSMLLKLYTL